MNAESFEILSSFLFVIAFFSLSFSFPLWFSCFSLKMIGSIVIEGALMRGVELQYQIMILQVPGALIGENMVLKLKLTNTNVWRYYSACHN